MTDTPLKLAISNGLPIIAGTLGYFRPLDATKIIGTVLCLGGSYGLAAPIPLGRLFGIPFSDPTNTLFVPGIAGRNLAAGLTTLALTYFAQAKQEAGTRRALGIFMAAWTLAGYSDCWILYNTAGSDNMGTHAFNIAVLTVTAFRLLRG